MNVVVLGAEGMLGRAFCEHLGRERVHYVALSRAGFDLGRDAPAELARFEPELVVNCAAYTDVDRAESERERALLINGTAVGDLAEWCSAHEVRLLHFSTDYVFDGTADEPYPTHAPRAPLNVYGESKALGEQRIEESRAHALVIRTSWVFAPWGRNFVRTMADLLQTRPEVRVVSDQWGAPTFAPDLATRSWSLALQKVSGVQHVTNGPPVSWYEFARTIQELQGSAARIVPVTTEEFPRPAARPRYSVLSTAGADALLGRAPAFPARVRAALASNMLSVPAGIQESLLPGSRAHDSPARGNKADLGHDSE